MRKSQFSTLTDLNPEFGGPLDMPGIFFVNVILTMLQKEYLAKKFLNSMHGFKSAILPGLPKGTYQPFHGIQKDFLPKDVF